MSNDVMEKDMSPARYLPVYDHKKHAYVESGDLEEPQPPATPSREARLVLQALEHAYRQAYPAQVGYPPEKLTRARLVERTGLADRVVRSAIQELRRLGHPVWSDSGSAGYRLAIDDAEVHALANRFEQTAKEHFVTAGRLRRRHAETMPFGDPSQQVLL